MIKKNLFIWVSDYLEDSGEGKLARLYLKSRYSTKKVNFIFNQKRKVKQRYFSSILGIIYCWKKYLQNEKVCYLNYLPLWNFLIFSLLPPNTIIGPITGGANYKREISFQYLMRNFFFPIFYKISEFFLYFRKIEKIFSTDLLKKYLSKKTINESKFNFVFKNIHKKVRKKKEIDFLIYYRNHLNKKKLFPIDFLKEISKNGLKIQVFGDRLNIKNISNLGKINNKKVNELLSKTKYTIISSENIYSLFLTECISNHVKILIDNNSTYQINYFKKSFIKFNFSNQLNKKNLKKLLINF